MIQVKTGDMSVEDADDFMHDLSTECVNKYINSREGQEIRKLTIKALEEERQRLETFKDGKLGKK
jgi:polyhydroxyalkanoate synthesis regulator phasin